MRENEDRADLHTAPPFPSVADALYLAGYPLYAGGLIALLGGFRSAAGRASLLDGGILASGLVVGGFIFLVEPNLGSGVSLSSVVGLAYPAVDLLLLAALAHLLVSGAWRVPAFALLAGAVTSMLAADIVYAKSAETYVAGAWVDSGWMLAVALWGAAALHPSMAMLRPNRRSAEAPGRARLALLTGAALVAPAVIAVEAAAGAHVHWFEIVLAAGAFLLVLGRMTGVVQELGRARASEHEAREQLAAQNDQLRQLDRMKDEFISTVSHELRTPLTSISGYLEIVLAGESGELQPEQERFLRIVERNSQRLLHLVSDLLLLAQIEAGNFALAPISLDLENVVTDAVEAARPAADAKEIELTLDATPALLVGDQARLGQVVDNLLSNAIKFTPAGGRVFVTVESGEKVRLSVADTGMGISAEDREQLFSRFFRTSAVVEAAISGSGLGLSIVQAIATAHGGTISVASEVGAGTTFVLELPAAAEEGSPVNELPLAA